MEDSPRLIIFVLHMYKQLTSEQRSQIFALLQRKCPRKEIARLPEAKELTSLAHRLTQTNHLDFEQSLEKWEQKWKDFLQEKTYGEEGKWHFTHRRTRSAFYSLKRNLNALFTFEKFPTHQVPRTNNAIESLNSVLKMRLRIHRGFLIEKRELLIGNILGAFNTDKH